MISGRALLVGIIALAGCQTPTSPYDFRATPASPVEGDDLTLSLTPTTGAPSPGMAAVDLYVSVTREGTGPRAWRFLDPAGRWTAARVRYRRIEPGDPEPVVMRFARVNPFGQYTFRAQLVRAGAPPSPQALPRPTRGPDAPHPARHGRTPVARRRARSRHRERGRARRGVSTDSPRRAGRLTRTPRERPVNRPIRW